MNLQRTVEYEADRVPGFARVVTAAAGWQKLKVRIPYGTSGRCGRVNSMGWRKW